MDAAAPPPAPAVPAEAAARALAEAAALAGRGFRRGDGGPFGAVVFDAAGQVVGRGWNRVLVSRDPTAHAEVEAIRDAARALATHDLSGCALATTCEPCPMCLGAILWARLGAVYYAAGREDAAAAGFDDRAFYAEFARPLAERRTPLIQLAPETGRELFRAFAAHPARQLY